MASSPTTISHWQEAKIDQARKAIDGVFAETGIDEDEVLDRLQALRTYIEELMDRLK